MEQVWFLFLYGWVPAALVVLWEAARCLRTDWRGEWKFLAWMLGLLAADLILWLMGEPVLAAFGLAWRAWLVSFLQGAALVLVVVWTLLVGLSVLCRDEAYSVVRKVILGVSICVVIGSAVTEGLFFWTFSTVEERVVASQDRTLVEEDRGFLDPFYVYYEYHGPLVRGRDRWTWACRMASACKRTNDERRFQNVRWMDESSQPAAGAGRLVPAPVGAAETEPKSWSGGGRMVLGRRSVLCSGFVFSAALWRQLCSGWGLVRSHGYQRHGGLALWFSAGNFLRDTACGPVCRPLEEAERSLTKCSGYLKKFMLP